MLPSSTDVSQADGQPEDCVACAKGNRRTGSASANSQPGMDGPHRSPITPNLSAGSSFGVKSPGRITALHRELRENHRKHCQVSKSFLTGFNLVKSLILGKRYRCLNVSFQRCTVDC